MKTFSKIIFLIIIFVINGEAQPINSQKQLSYDLNNVGQTVWFRYYDYQGGRDVGNGGLQTYDGGFIFLASSSRIPNNINTDDILLIKTNYLGIIEWQRILGDSISREFGYSFVQTIDSGYIIVGANYNIGTYGSALVIKADKYGYQQWRKIFLRTNGSVNGNFIKQTQDGGFIFTGSIFYSSTNSEYGLVVKLNSFGELEWQKEFEDLVCNEIILSIDGNYYFAGDNSIKKLNSVGEIIWIRPVDGNVQTLVQFPSSIFIYISGTVDSSGIQRMYVAKIDTSGNFYWSKKYLYGFANTGGICLSRSNRLVLCGTGKLNFKKSSDMVLLELNASGDTIQSKILATPGDYFDLALSVNSTSDNGFILAGVTFYPHGFDEYANVIAAKLDSLFNTNPLVFIRNQNEFTKKFELHQNYPNPFNPSTTISYHLQKNSFVILKIFNILGSEVKTVLNKRQNAGEYYLEFNGVNFPSGIYIYKLEIDGIYFDFKKMLLVK